MAKTAVKQHGSLYKFSLVGVVLVTLIALIFFFAWARHTQTFIDATSRQPERFTELYFANPNNLPSVVTTGQEESVTFIVHNLEAKNMVYTYQIQIEYQNGTIYRFDRKELALNKGVTENAIDGITIPKITGRAEIIIQLVNQPENIHYWVQVTA